MASVDPLKKVHFAFGGNQYMVDEVEECEVQYVHLPDCDRMVCLREWAKQFYSYGRYWDLSIPAQPMRVDQFDGTFGVSFPVHEAVVNTTGKNFLVQRLSFVTWGREYRVGPEAYGNCHVWAEDGPECKPVLIRLPMPRSETFYQASEWSPPGTKLEILAVELTHDVYLLDPAGKPILEEVKDKDGNPTGVKKPIFRPYVWATGPHKE